MELEDGLIARDGWTLIDDSQSLLFDDDPKWQWVEERKSTDGQDWYFMAYGTDYKRALNDFTVFAGKMPLPPRYAFGYWWSRYWMYSDKELRNVVKGMRNYGFPLDVLVIELNASSRAVAWLGNSGLADSWTMPKAKDALKWAAYTYVIAAIGSIATLLYYVAIAMGGRRD